MLDTASVKFYTGRSLSDLGIIWGNLFNLTRASTGNKKLIVDLSKDVDSSWGWVNRVQAEFEKGETVVIIDYSYSRFLEDDNLKLLASEKDFKRVNNELFRFAKHITQDKHLELDVFEFIRVDVAKQYKTNFEKHYNVFKFLYLLLERKGTGTKESKTFLQVTYGQNGDFTTGFRYKRGGYCITVYNKTLQMNKADYIPYKTSLLRCEQSFTGATLKHNGEKILLKNSSVEFFKKKYKEMMREKIVSCLECELNTTYTELTPIIEDIVKRRKIKEELRYYDGKILDQKLVLNIITNMELKKSERSRYYYKTQVKDKLTQKTEIYRDFKKVLSNLETFIYKVCDDILTIELDKNGIKVSLKNVDQV